MGLILTALLEIARTCGCNEGAAAALPKLEATNTKSKRLIAPSPLTSPAIFSGSSGAGIIYHRIIVPSPLPLASVLPSGLNDTLLTPPVPVRVALG